MGRQGEPKAKLFAGRPPNFYQHRPQHAPIWHLKGQGAE